MNKHQFLNGLYIELSPLSETERQKSLDFYSEMIDDRIEDGMTEEEAVAAVGRPEAIAREVLLNQSLPVLIKSKVKKSHTLKGWEIALLIIGAPLWLPLLIAAAVIVLSVYVVIWSVIISLYAAAVSLAVSFPACVVSAVIFIVRGGLPAAALTVGAGFILGGLSVFAFMGVNRLAKALVTLSRIILRKIKAIFITKEEAL